jgi:pyrophosphatase PpaX
LRVFFDVYVYKDDTAKHKPDPDPLIYAAGRLGITDMSRVIYVGDAMPDALCARNAGADFALVSWSKMDKEQIVREVPKTGVIGALADLD